MLTFTHRIAQEFDKLVDERMKIVTEALTEGSSLSFEELRKYQGLHQGLREAKDLMEEAVSICEGKSRGE